MDDGWGMMGLCYNRYSYSMLALNGDLFDWFPDAPDWNAMVGSSPPHAAP